MECVKVRPKGCEHTSYCRISMVKSVKHAKEYGDVNAPPSRLGRGKQIPAAGRKKKEAREGR